MRGLKGSKHKGSIIAWKLLGMEGGPDGACNESASKNCGGRLGKDL